MRRNFSLILGVAAITSAWLVCFFAVASAPRAPWYSGPGDEVVIVDG